MAKRKNSYKQKAHRKSFLDGLAGDLPTKGKMKNTLMETGKDLIIGVIGGGVLGAILGKPAFLLGIAATGAGHYIDNRFVQLIGIGMMAAPVIKNSPIAGLDGFEGIKERLLAYKETLTDKMYLDKIMKKKAEVEGIGDVQYFTYPDSSVGDLAALDDIENQLAASATDFEGVRGFRGNDDIGMLSGADEMMY